MMERRTFLKRSFIAVSTAIGAILALPGLRYLLDPLTRGRRTEDYFRVLPLSALVPGQPVRVPVIAERTDAYTHHPPGAIGHVFLIRDPDGPNGPVVRCMQVTCPHLGCQLDFATDRDAFACPCHASDFDKSGKRRMGPSPRDMDPLECRVSEPDASGQHWVEVQFVEYITGTSRRTPKA